MGKDVFRIMGPRQNHTLHFLPFNEKLARVQGQNNFTMWVLARNSLPRVVLCMQCPD
jgi:hypothetical protein